MAQAKTQRLSLGERWNSFISAQVDYGGYASASEVVRDALRLMEEKNAESKLKILRKALLEGEESGNAGELNFKVIKKEVLDEMGLDP